MIKLYDKTYTTEYGSLDTVIEAFVEEERNGLFELSFIILNTDNLFNYVKEENIVVANANDMLLNQKFRIYMTRKLMNNRVEVFARHISFDLMYDYIDNLSFTNQSCQYALNQLFLNSNFSKHYKGYSNIVNAQNYSMSMANVLEAIGGKKGSIIDTFGTGAEILRDNENIHVLNKRGHDNGVTIEYRKNLTGFELEEDTTDLITKILPYAKYNDKETSEEIIVKADFIDSPLMNNYSHPYIKYVDYSEKFEDSEIPTIDKLIKFAEDEFKNNKVDIPKQNFKIDFIPLSKCVGYEGLEDRVSICDTVTIIDTRYNINTQAKVIKTIFNVLKNRYESIELGDPKTTLGDVVGNNDTVKGEKGEKGDKGDKGEDGNLGDFPNSLPATPILESFVYGFSNIELNWTFENKIYYQYELYASKVKDFTPNSFDLIFQGQASSYMFQAKPNETWYFKVCAINTYGERTEFSNQTIVTTTKIEDLSNYVENMAINEALIGTLSLDRGWIGRLNANLLDVKGNFSVTDGNGKRTLDIDSFGNINIDASSLKINSSDVGTMINGKVSFGDLSVSGKTTINGGNITSGIIRGINIISTNTDNEQRCAMLSDGMRFYSPTKQAGRICFDSNGEGTESSATDRFLIESWNGYAMKILSEGDLSLTAKNYNGYNDIFLEADKVRLNNKLLVDGAVELYSTLNAGGNITSNGYIKSTRVETTGDIVAGNDIYVKGSYKVYHTGNKPTASAIGALSTSGGIISGSLTTTGTTKANRLEAAGDIVSGNNIWASNKVYANNVALTSDRNLKTGIKYINKDIQSIDENGLMNPNTNITTDDMHEFIETLPIVSYRLKSDVENGEDHTCYGFIAQDILYTKVGSELIHIIPEEQRTKDEDGNIIEDGLRYSEDKFVAFIAGALQKEIKLRNKLETRVKELENKLNNLKQGGIEDAKKAD